MDNKFLKMTFQSLNTVFSNLLEDPNKVLWIRDKGYNRQLFLSTASYEAIWKRPAEQLYQFPSSWNDYLLGEHPAQFVQFLKSRWPDTNASEEKNIVLYRVTDSAGNICWIKDTHFYLFDETNQQVAVAGIAQAVSAEHWLHELKKCNRLQSPQEPHQQDLFNLIKKEFQLTARSNAHAILLGKGDEYERYFILRSGKKIIFSKRENECLQCLIQGNSAKQIAKKLLISPRTVELHICHIKEKAGCRTTLELLAATKGFSI